MLKRPCRTCGKPTRNNACHPVQSASRRGYDATYRRNREAVVTHWRRLNLPCVICGHRIAPNEPITAEHLTPRSRGGTSALGNLGGAHARCNYGHGGQPGTRRLPVLLKRNLRAAHASWLPGHQKAARRRPSGLRGVLQRIPGTNADHDVIPGLVSRHGEPSGQVIPDAVIVQIAEVSTLILVSLDVLPVRPHGR